MLRLVAVLLVAGLAIGAGALAAGRWVIVATDGRRLGGVMGIPEYHDSEAACLDFKAGVVERAKAVARQRTGASTSPLAEAWAAGRCVPE